MTDKKEALLASFIATCYSICITGLAITLVLYTFTVSPWIAVGVAAFAVVWLAWYAYFEGWF